MVKHNKCIVCDKSILWGDFSYEQKICWMCFKNKVIDITNELNPIEKRLIVIFLLACLAEQFGKNRDF